jgi:hypothetical protein
VFVEEGQAESLETGVEEFDLGGSHGGGSGGCGFHGRS